MIIIDNDNPKVLLVDDKSENIAVLINMLESLNLEIFIALDAQAVYQQVELYDFDLILLDILMPDITGYEVCEKLKANPKYKDIPIIFISALSSVEDKIKGFSYGVDDYITKPFLEKELIARVRLHLQKGILYKSLKHLLKKSYHELYNPLAVINTSLEMQNIKHGNSKYIDSITTASRTLQVVYDDLYYSISSDTQNIDAINIDLKSFIKKRIDYFYYLKNSKNIDIKFINIGEYQLNIKESDLQRIIDNTISNAIKYAQQNSTITIELINNKEDIVFKSKNYGINIKDTTKIFNSGYRENYEQIGMGIGLEIVALICKTYDIKTNVTSKDGMTIFEYKFPKVNYKGYG